MSTIKYDRPVKNLIKGLDQTGHVTHKKFRKTSVTFHHNAGRLSLEDVLKVWRYRPASAHFDSDPSGNIGQYVRVAEYAWSCGNTQGNMESIHIEMANAELGPNWTVGEVTWKSAARLAGWLFAKVIGEAPTRDNVHFHHHWYATACAGPFMDKVYDQLLSEVQKSYNHFKSGGGSHNNKDRADRDSHREPIHKSLTQIAAEVWAGKWGSGDDRVRRLKSAGYNPQRVQELVNRGVGKGGGSSAPSRPRRKSFNEVVGEVIDGKWGNGDDRKRRLAAAGYNASRVQSEVNHRLGFGGPVNRKSVSQLANEVIAGKWGNGPARAHRLDSAGYDAVAVQREVNRKLA